MQNKIDSQIVTNFINDEKIRKFYDTDPISFVYYLYLINNYPNSKNQKDLVKQAGLSKDFAIQKIIYHFQMDDYLSMIYPITNRILKYQGYFKSIILSIIVHSLEANKTINTDLERIEECKLPKNLGNILIISTYFKEFIFNEDVKIESVDFYFFNDYLNTLAFIAFGTLNVPCREVNPYKIDSVYDTIIYHPPYKYSYYMLEYMKQLKTLGVSNVSLEIKEIYRLSLMLKQTGSMVSLIQTGALSKQKDIPYKKILVEKGRVNSVIELPKIKDYSLPLSLVFFSGGNKEISIVNASKFAMNIRRGTDIDSEKILRALNGQIEGALGKVTLEDAQKLYYDITPHRFFEVKGSELSGTVKLKDITTQIFRGYQISSDMLDDYLSESETKIKLLTLGDIEDDEINKESLQSLKDLDKKMVHYCLKDNDVIICWKGTSIKTAVVEIPYKETYVSTGSLIIIRVDENKIDPYFLKIYLDSKLGRKELKSIQTGTTILSLNPTKLCDLEIPLPEMDKQYLISSSYKYKLKNIKEVKEIIDDMKHEMEKKFSDNFIDLIK